jgi:hypothetical protein
MIMKMHAFYCESRKLGAPSASKVIDPNDPLAQINSR